MLFNSYEFIFLFLPVTFVVYFVFSKYSKTLASIWLVVASLFFYSWWNITYLPLILGSLLFNFLFGRMLLKNRKKPLLVIGVIANLLLLGYFKYTDFFLSNVNYLFNSQLPLLHLALPLAISFFTFQQIAYLVDSYRNETKKYNFFEYALFVTFFPQLIAGPIVHHQEVIPQFNDEQNRKIDLNNISRGLFIFSIGLFKKVVIADQFAIYANHGFDMASRSGLIESWITSLSYTMQLYFDFSGYTDMAIGLALLFNIILPINFFSPYKAVNIKDFWARWHMTLTRFLTKYLYIPLGGSRKKYRTSINIMIVFVCSGLWHGAGWTFVFWGFLHGLASVIYRFWSKLPIRLPKPVAWFITFNFVNAAWVFFRAKDWGTAINILKGMIGLNGVNLPSFLVKYVNSLQSVHFVDFSISTVYLPGLLIMIALCIAFYFKNSIERLREFKPNLHYAFAVSLLFIYAVLNLNRISEFIYFNF